MGTVVSRMSPQIAMLRAMGSAAKRVAELRRLDGMAAEDNGEEDEAKIAAMYATIETIKAIGEVCDIAADDLFDQERELADGVR